MSHHRSKPVAGRKLTGGIKNCRKFIWLFLGQFCGAYISNVCFMFTGERLTQRIRENYVASVLRQNQAFFDKLGTGEITVKITSDTNQVQNAIAE